VVAREEKGIIRVPDHASMVIPANTSIRHSKPLSMRSGQSETSSRWPERNGRTTVALVDEHVFTRECITGFLKELDDTLDFVSFSGVADCLQSTKPYDGILYYASETDLNRDDAKRKQLEITDLAKLAPVIILSTVDYYDAIIDGLKIGAHAFIPASSTTPRQVIEIIRLVKAGGIYAPASLYLQRLNGSRPISLTKETHKFSARESKVLEHLMRGKANKAIAFELAISESTVKAHIKSIMSKLKATNRTEAVCRAYDLSVVGALSVQRG